MDGLKVKRREREGEARKCLPENFSAKKEEEEEEEQEEMEKNLHFAQ